MPDMRTLLPLVALLLPVATHANQQCSGRAVHSEGEFRPIGDGSTVLDRKTRLVWTRCIEGQSWTGRTCAADDPDAVNPGPGVSFQQAQATAASRSTANEHWRIPTAAELRGLREPGCYNPSVSLDIFPTSPAWSSDGDFWSSTREGGGYSVVSAIGTSDAWSATSLSDNHGLHLRLVRMARPDEQ